MQLTFLGTGAGAPSPQRNVAAVALRLPQRSEVWLFDCGEATQHRLMASPVSIGQITRIFISHLHGDHVFGLPGLLATRGLGGLRTPIDIYGPRGLRAFLDGVLSTTTTWVPYPLGIHEVEPGDIFDDGGFRVRCAPLVHGVECLGYRVDEHTLPGRLDADRAAELGVPNGPLLGRLKRGESVELADGTLVSSDDVVGPPIRGRSVVYCTDTSYTSHAVELARDCDLLVHEATFAECDADIADDSGHSTASTAARVAAEAGAARLVLTHISARYGPAGSTDVSTLEAEARAIFPETVAADEMMTVDIDLNR